MALIVCARQQRAAATHPRASRVSAATGYDEVWDGVYVHVATGGQRASRSLGARWLRRFIQASRRRSELPGLRRDATSAIARTSWKKNYRCPDVAVFLPGNPAEDRGTHWLGGPDFAVEVLSPDDRSRKKLDFYAKVGVRELLLVDRKPWSPGTLPADRWEAGRASARSPAGDRPNLPQRRPPALLPPGPRRTPPEIEVTQPARRPDLAGLNSTSTIPPR